MARYGLKWYGPRVTAIIRRGLADQLATMGRQVRDRAKELCPVDTGRLRDSISIIVDARGVRLVVFSDVPYAVFQEEGTRYVEGKHFIERAINEVTASFVFHTITG